MQPPIYRDTLVLLYEPWYLIIVMISCSIRHSLPPPASMHLKILTSLFLCSSAFSCLPTFDARSWKRESERKCVCERERERAGHHNRESLSLLLSLSHSTSRSANSLPSVLRRRKKIQFSSGLGVGVIIQQKKNAAKKFRAFFHNRHVFLKIRESNWGLQDQRVAAEPRRLFRIDCRLDPWSKVDFEGKKQN